MIQQRILYIAFNEGPGPARMHHRSAFAKYVAFFVVIPPENSRKKNTLFYSTIFSPPDIFFSGLCRFDKTDAYSF